jgi:hypothetical protein
MTAFCFFFILCSTKRLETTALVPRGQKTTTSQKLFLFLTKNNKMEFRFDPGEHSLQVSAKSIAGSGCGVEWVKLAGQSTFN